MKLNETLLIGLALVAALVFSKSGSASSIFKKSSVPFLPLENKTISFMENFPYLEKFKQIFPVKETNVQLANVSKMIYNYRDIAEKQKDERLSYLQNEQKMVQEYIGTQTNPYTPNLAFTQIAPDNWSGRNLLKKFDRDGDPNRSLFPDFYLGYTKQNRDIIAQQAQYETAEKDRLKNIEKANAYLLRQQGDIDNLNDEYQTRFGSLSRYG